MRIRTLPVGLGLTFVVLAAACGGGATPSPSPSPSSPPPSVAPASSPPASMEPSESASASASGDPVVQTATTDLGTILVDADGMTLYGFTPDTAGVSTCYDDCAAAWPPVVVEGDIVVGPGLDVSTFTLAARTDGTQQLKAGDWPLYLFSGDQAPGDVNGQGQNGVWFVVDAEGELIQ